MDAGGYSAGSGAGCMDFPCRAGEQSEFTAGNVCRVERVNRKGMFNAQYDFGFCLIQYGPWIFYF